MKEKKHINKFSVFLLYSLYLLSLANLFVTGPILAPMLLSSHSSMVAVTMSSGMRAYLVGAIMACTVLGQFIGGPIVGELSDQFGRKTLLLYMLVLAVLANVMSVVSIHWHSLAWFTVSRLLAGIATAIMPVIVATLSRLDSMVSVRFSYMGYITVASALGMVASGFIGGWMSAPSVVSWFSYATPFALFIVLFAVVGVLLAASFRDEAIYVRRKLNVWSGLRNIRQAFAMPHLRSMMLAYTLYSVSIQSFFVSFPIIMVIRYHVAGFTIGNVMMFGAAISIASIFLLSRWVGRNFLPYKVCLYALCVFCLALLGYAFSIKLSWMLFPFALLAAVDVYVWASYYSMIGSMVAEDVQGKVFGVVASIGALASLLGALVIAHLAAVHYVWTIVFAIITALLSAFVLVKHKPYLHRCIYH